MTIDHTFFIRTQQLLAEYIAQTESHIFEEERRISSQEEFLVLVRHIAKRNALRRLREDFKELWEELNRMED